MLEKRGCQPLVYPQNRTSATGEQSNLAALCFFCSSCTRVPEADTPDLRPRAYRWGPYCPPGPLRAERPLPIPGGTRRLLGGCRYLLV